ncbi:MAG: phage tail protein [Acidimicrobiales bacterium]
MSTPYLGEIRLFSFSYAPEGWAMCNGQTLAINQNQALFALLGTTYGGNGTTNFNLPNLQGRSPAHTGGSAEYELGEEVGVESVTLTTSQIPSHSHLAYASSGAAQTASPGGNLWANNAHTAFSTAAPDTNFDPSAVATAGGSQPHENRSPYLVLNYCIALQGIFPSRN